MDYEAAELEILEALDAGEITRDDAVELLGALEQKANPVVEEMHPDVTGRFTYKNFGVGSEDGFNYLQKENPNLDFRKDEEGRIQVKGGNSGETWMYLDPPGFDWRDVTDIAWDVPAGIAEGVAAGVGGVLGGIGGTAVAPGPGTVGGAAGGAMLFGGAAGAGTEALRQKIGQELGVAQGYDTGDIKMSGAFGAAGPLLFGAGGKVAKGLVKDAAKRGAIQDAQRSLVGRSAGYVMPKVASAVSGVGEGTIRTADTMVPEIKAAQREARETGKSYADADIVKDFRFNVVEPALESKKIQVSDNYAKALENLGPDKTLNVSDSFAPLNDLMTKYERARNKDLNLLTKRHGEEKAQELIKAKASYKQFQNVKSIFDELVPVEPYISPRAGKDVQNLVNDFSKIRQRTDAAGENKALSQEIVNATRQVAEKLDTNIKNSPTGGKELKEAAQEFGDFKRLEENLQSRFGKLGATEDSYDTKQALSKTEAQFKKLVGRGKSTDKEAIDTLGDQLGVDISKQAEKMEALKVYTDPQFMPYSSGGTTSSTRTLALQQAGEGGGYAAGKALGVTMKRV
jgi:molybdopterin converting factor small subunit